MSGHPDGLLPFGLCLREYSKSRRTGKELDAERKRGCSVKFFPCAVSCLSTDHMLLIYIVFGLLILAFLSAFLDGFFKLIG